MRWNPNGWRCMRRSKPPELADCGRRLVAADSVLVRWPAIPLCCRIPGSASCQSAAPATPPFPRWESPRGREGETGGTAVGGGPGAAGHEGGEAQDEWCGREAHDFAADQTGVHADSDQDDHRRTQGAGIGRRCSGRRVHGLRGYGVCGMKNGPEACTGRQFIIS